MLLSQKITERGPNSRRGITLAEVLIALFVLAIGMLGILALFPLGASQMAQAVKDERCSQLADISEGHMRIFWRMAWLTNTGYRNTPTTVYTNSPEYRTMIVASPGPGPSVPIYIDPIGYGVGQPSTIAGIAGASGGVARYPMTLYQGPAYYQNLASPPSATTTPPSTITTQGLGVAGKLRLFANIDDVSFNANGLAGSSVNRGDRYTASYMLQLPKANVPWEVNLKVVVYQGRRPDVASPETPVTLTGSVTPGADYIPMSTAAVPLRINSWILLMGSTPEPFADFYRVVGITPSLVSVSPPIRMHGSTTSAYSANGAFLSDVVEVFDRGTITPYEAPGP